MRKALYGFLCCLTLVGQSFAIGLAIKLDITQEVQEIIKQISQAGPLATPSESKLVVTVPHVTIGYIENLPTLLSAQEAEKIATTFIAEYLQTNPLLFTVEDCQIKFSGQFTSLVPTPSSAAILKEVNARLEQYRI